MCEQLVLCVVRIGALKVFLFNSSSCVSTDTLSVYFCLARTGGCTCKFDSAECERAAVRTARKFFVWVAEHAGHCNYYSICGQLRIYGGHLGKTPNHSFSWLNFKIQKIRAAYVDVMCEARVYLAYALGITALAVNLQLLRCACSYYLLKITQLEETQLVLVTLDFNERTGCSTIVPESTQVSATSMIITLM